MLTHLTLRHAGQFVAFSVLFISSFWGFAQEKEPTWIRLAVIQVESRTLADSIFKQLKAGESFYYFAIKYSQDLTAKDGGEMDWKKITKLPTQIQSVVRNLGLDNFSSIIEYNDKYWLFKKLGEGSKNEYNTWEATTSKVKSLDKKIRKLSKTRKYSEAIALASQALKLREQTLGVSHPSFALNIHTLATLYDAQVNDSVADSLNLLAINIWKKIFGQDYPIVAARLINLSWSTYEQESYTVLEPTMGSSRRNSAGGWRTHVPGDLQQKVFDDPIRAARDNSLMLLYNTLKPDEAAEELHLHALKNYEQMYGAEHYEIVPSLVRLAKFYHTQGQYPSAESFYLRALKIAEKWTPDQPLVASSLDDLAKLYSDQGNYIAAEPLYQRALRIREKVMKKDDSNIAMSLNNLAKIHYLQGNFAIAEPLYRRALKISESALGQNHPDVAKCLNNLGLLCHDRGDYTKAEQLYLRALKIKEQVHGPNHSEVATSLNNLAELHREQGNYAKAEELCQRALKISVLALKVDHLEIATILNNLALIRRAQGDVAATESFYQRAIKIREQNLGPDHPDVATSLNNFASLYLPQGNYAAAESLYQRALKIREKSLGSGHPEVASNLNNLAWINYAQNRFLVSKQLYERALNIWKQVLGQNHPNVAKTLHNLGLVEMAINQPELAKNYFQNAVDIETAIMQDLLAYSTEFEKLAFKKMLARGLDNFITLASQFLYTDSITVRAAFKLTLQRKSTSLESSSEQQQVYLASSDSVTAQLFERFRTLSQQIAQLTFAGPRDTALTTYRQKLDTLFAEREQIENILGQQSGAFLRERQTPQTDIRRVSAALPTGSALIEILRYPKIDFKAKDKNRMASAVHYAAFCLPTNDTGNLKIFDLGPAQPIDSLVHVYSQEIKNVLNLGLKQQKESEQRLAKITNRLYHLIFTPMMGVLPDSGALYCAPDGLLHLLPFEILTDKAGKFLIERYQFNYLDSGRDLLRFASISQTGKMYVLANPNFDGIPAQIAWKASILSSSSLMLPLENIRRSRDWRGGKFDRLDSTFVEAKAIQSLFGLNDDQLFLDLRATEKNLVSLKSPWRLHIATHGFFLKDQEDIKQLARPELYMSTFSEQRLELGQFENPLLRSGLALTGANSIGQKKDSSQVYDGIATAYEISGMNLQGTDLVVLSACETGLGEVQNGEGVFGLRRSFQLAGAQTVVMSLWKVPDNETKELMIDFYTRLKNSEGKSQALRNAQLAMMRKQREQYGSAHPYFWGAFICAGNPE